MKINLARVYYMPRILKAGVLYFSEEYDCARHLCVCGCGEVVSTPLGPTDWSLSEDISGPTLYPSVGNWQLKCQSHYWIRDGRVIWSEQWTEEEILEGRMAEQVRRDTYYGDPQGPRASITIIQRIYSWLAGIFKT